MADRRPHQLCGLVPPRASPDHDVRPTSEVISSRSDPPPDDSLLAVYYTLCDIIIMAQIYYYRWKASRPRPSSASPVSGSTETAPLLSSSAAPAPPKRRDAWTRFKAAIIIYSLAFGVILIVGFGGWLITEGRIRIPGRSGPSRPHDPPEEDPGSGETWDTGAQVVGWISAAAYLGSRLPQILKNMQTKCHGLSMLFFLVRPFRPRRLLSDLTHATRTDWAHREHQLHSVDPPRVHSPRTCLDQPVVARRLRRDHLCPFPRPFHLPCPFPRADVPVFPRPRSSTLSSCGSSGSTAKNDWSSTRPTRRPRRPTGR